MLGFYFLWYSFVKFLWFDVESRVLGNYIEIRSHYFVKLIDFQGTEYYM